MEPKIKKKKKRRQAQAHIFDIRAGMYCDHVTVLDTEVVPDHTVDAGTSIIKIVVGQHDQHGVLAHFALDQDGITTEQLQCLHGIV